MHQFQITATSSKGQWVWTPLHFWLCHTFLIMIQVFTILIKYSLYTMPEIFFILLLTLVTNINNMMISSKRMIGLESNQLYCFKARYRIFVTQ